MLTSKDSGDMTINEAIKILDDKIARTTNVDTKTRLELEKQTFEDFKFRQNMGELMNCYITVLRNNKKKNLHQ